MYVWDGFWRVDVAPSPKAHDNDAAPVDASVNWTSSGARPVVGEAVKSATGGETMAIVIVAESLVLAEFRGHQ